MSEPDKIVSSQGETSGNPRVPPMGTFGMTVLVISLSILFGASCVALLVTRSRASAWPPHGMPPLPSSLWISTVIILLASAAVQRARNAIRRGERERLKRFLRVTGVIGLLFLAVQTINWMEFYGAIRNIQFSGAYLGMFYVLTGLHAAHVIGGLIPLAVVLRRARQGVYSQVYHPGVTNLAIYWHFLDVVWILLFILIYF
jgi:cytochrome c oxidase subunit III